mgnify:CR=1 FL=1
MPTNAKSLLQHSAFTHFTSKKLALYVSSASLLAACSSQPPMPQQPTQPLPPPVIVTPPPVVNQRHNYPPATRPLIAGNLTLSNVRLPKAIIVRIWNVC